MKEEDMESLRPTVSHAYDQQWDSATVNSASDIIRSLASSLAGVSPGQLLFTSQNEEGLILFAAWWPWDNGSTVSLRIGPFSVDEDAFDRDKKKEYLTAWCNF